MIGDIPPALVVSAEAIIIFELDEPIAISS